MYLSLKQTAVELGKTERQVRYLINENLISPVNPDTYRRDGGYRFAIHEVQRVKENFNQEGLSLRNASKLIGITPQYLSRLAIEGKIASKLVQVGNRMERYFSTESCNDLQSQIKIKSSKKVAHFGKKLALYHNNRRIFELIKHANELVRVINTEPITLLKMDGTTISNIDDLDIRQSAAWPDVPYNTKKGFIEFKLSIPRSAEHHTYDALYTLIRELGPRNIQVFEQKDGDFYLRCRQGKINLPSEYFNILKRYLIKGDVIEVEGQVKFISDFTSQYIHLPNELHKSVEKVAVQNSKSIQEQLIELIELGMNSIKD